ncbi:3beta-hydroxysteroid-dehydrogenase/decarboxylase-like isoform X2 [Asparagus officinalis]|nr:3beta-hydroxysteroid-dehydrogenase/decarboxylase-like isoform X2 [Asparagus officinalis]
MESMSYPEKFNDSYSETKAEGERLVINANGKNGLLTCCIRPSSIFGPGDKLLVPSLVSAAKAGKSKFIIGDGNNLYDFTYVENVAYGHICAERTLASGGCRAEKAAGQAYFITNNEPIKLWEFFSLILEGLGYERPSINIPVAVVMPIARFVEYTYKSFSHCGLRVPQLTPSRVRLLSCNRTFSCTKARVHLDYEPLVPLKEGLKRTVASYSHLRAVPRSRASKVSLILGNGKMANTLLWKDKKQTLTVLLVLAIIYYYLFAFGYTFITAVSKLLSLAAFYLFGHGFLPTEIQGIKFGKIPPSYFHLSERKAHRLACVATSSWNSAVRILKSLCRGKDWPLFLKVVSILLSISFLGTLPLQSIFTLGVSLLFFGFVVYEKWEKEIDVLCSRAYPHFLKLKADALQKLSNN